MKFQAYWLGLCILNPDSAVRVLPDISGSRVFPGLQNGASWSSSVFVDSISAAEQNLYGLRPSLTLNKAKRVRNQLRMETVLFSSSPSKCQKFCTKDSMVF